MSARARLALLLNPHVRAYAPNRDLGYLATSGGLAIVLAELYENPLRKYHAIGHVIACLEHLEDGGDLTPRDRATAGLALAFHDAIYDPRSKQNEDDSAGLAYLTLLAGGGDFANDVARAVLGTKHPPTPPMTTVEAVVRDIDLASLASPPEEFDANSSAIREEYSFVPMDRYRIERARIMRGFLDRPVIFHTPSFHDRLEVAARANVEREIRALEQPR